MRLALIKVILFLMILNGISGEVQRAVELIIHSSHPVRPEPDSNPAAGSLLIGYLLRQIADEAQLSGDEDVADPSNISGNGCAGSA